MQYRRTHGMRVGRELAPGLFSLGLPVSEVAERSDTGSQPPWLLKWPSRWSYRFFEQLKIALTGHIYCAHRGEMCRSPLHIEQRHVGRVELS